MGHIHELVDLVVAAYIVHDGKILLVHHKKVNKWLPVGGHVELNEDTDEALFREIAEEAGLNKDDLIFIGEEREIDGAKFLLVPQSVNIHKIDDTHKHLCLDYFVKSKNDGIVHNKEEHNSIKWFSEKDLADVPENVRLLAREAIKAAATSE